MARIPVITDTHFGARGDSAVLFALQERFFTNVFWPAIDAEGGVTEMLHLGDVTDRRRHIQYETLAFAKRVFFDPLRERGIKLTWILGNHDLPFKHTTALSSAEAFREYDNVHVVAQAEVREYQDTQVLLMPWLCDGTLEPAMEALARFSGRTVAGHFELYGFDMYRGMPNLYHGLKPDLFDDMALVMTGHYHHRSNRDAVHYLGSPYDMIWSDAEDPRGFHWWTPQDNTVTFVESPHRLFYRWTYDDFNQPITYVRDLLAAMQPHVAGNIIKVIVRQKTQPVWYETFADAVLRMGPYDYQFIDDPHASVAEAALTLDPETTLDTLNVITRHVASSQWANTEVQHAVSHLLTGLYHDAVECAKSVSRG